MAVLQHNTKELSAMGQRVLVSGEEGEDGNKVVYLFQHVLEGVRLPVSGPASDGTVEKMTQDMT